MRTGLSIRQVHSENIHSESCMSSHLDLSQHDAEKLLQGSGVRVT